MLRAYSDDSFESCLSASDPELDDGINQPACARGPSEVQSVAYQALDAFQDPEGCSSACKVTLQASFLRVSVMKV